MPMSYSHSIPGIRALSVALAALAALAGLAPLTMVVVPILYWELRSREVRLADAGSNRPEHNALTAQTARTANTSNQESENV